MKKIIISSIFLILLISAFSTIFAANTTTGNMMSNVGDTMQGAAENTRNKVSNMETVQRMPKILLWVQQTMFKMVLKMFQTILVIQ